MWLWVARHSLRVCAALHAAVEACARYIQMAVASGSALSVEAAKAGMVRAFTAEWESRFGGLPPPQGHKLWSTGMAAIQVLVLLSLAAAVDSAATVTLTATVAALPTGVCTA
jgi:hypothetical protein